MSDTYKSLIKDAVDLHALRQTQRDWLTIRNKCKTVECISQSYNLRQYQLSMVPRKGWKEYTDKTLGVSFSYPSEYKIGSCPQDYGENCVAILDKPQKMPYSDYVIAFRVVNGGLKENAVKEAGFKYSDGKWIAFPAPAQSEPIEVEHFSFNNWQGMKVLITCGINDDLGFHAAGGDCFSGVISNGKNTVVADTQGIIGNDSQTFHIMETLRFL